MTEELLPVLLIVVPILGATLPLVLGLFRERVGWAVAAGTLSVEAAVATWLGYAVYIGDQRVVHVLGGETFGRKEVTVGEFDTEGFIVGIELVADALSGLLVVLVALVALAVLAYARRAGPRRNAFYSAYLLLTGGLMGLVLTGDLFNLFVFLEIVGLMTYALVASDRSGASAVAALKYLIIGTTGASMYLVGVGYLFVRTGTLNMVDVSRVLAGEPAWVENALYSEPLVVASFGFIAVGLATKAAIFPLHTWQPDAYSESPDSVTVLISALVSTTAAYALARITWVVFSPDFFAANPRTVELLLAIAAVSVVAGSLLAAMQRRVKRVFAYSSVAQFGLIVMAVGTAVHPAAGDQATQFAVYGVVVHLIGHAVIKGGLFAAIGALNSSAGARYVREYAGLAKQRPFLSGSLAVLGFSLIGVPPAVGFVGKWYIGLAAVEAELWPLVFVVFASTLLTLLYVARLLEKLYFTPLAAETDTEPRPAVAADGGGSVSYGMVALAVLAAVLAVGLGFAGAELTDAVQPLVEAIQESSPEVHP
ncbi:multisubunit sodium/proton antiporter, MrpD subunit [Halovenus aranensis]|uniref:Multisubunit sodium/proton antiporter, MrpD subunit n=1 Tax=Halovenus aranensis TaxID=890420 RepID=A0A1G8TTG0_9EURY|nr:proton-conducting transporter membrane subunit [Halovenus aranensis]SDJ44727.1 multisubunit sodium/proton antiporter, MrpD subunit [Halovenus aranensis]